MKPVVGVTTAVAALLVLSACSATPASSPTPTGSPSPSPSPWPASECVELAATVGTALQNVVDSYDQPPQAPPSPTASPAIADSADIQDALEEVRQSVVDEHCAADLMRSEVDAGIAAVEAESPLAEAVRAKLVAGLEGRIPEAPVRLPVFPDDDLPTALAEAPAGSTLLLSEGEWILDGPLVLINGITLIGKGEDATTLTSSAEEAAVLVATGEPVGLESLTLSRDGDVPGSGVVAGGGATLSLTSVTLSGSRTGDGGGGAGVMLVGGDVDAEPRRTTLEATDITARDNGWAGIAVTGAHRVSVEGATLTGNGECGLCFLGGADGSVSAATFADNKVGVAVAEQASPTLLGLTIDGGEVGLQAEGSAAPVVEVATVTGASRAAVIMGGESTGALASVVCEDVEFGIVVTDTAAPTLVDNTCTLARGSFGSASPSPED